MLLLATIPFLIIFYMLLIRPQQQRVREHQELVESLTVGDQIVTAGGLHGRITALDADTAQIEVADQVVLTFARPAISKRLDPDGPADPLEDDVVAEDDVVEANDVTIDDQAGEDGQ